MTLRENWKQLASELIDKLDSDTELDHNPLRNALKETELYAEFYEKASLLISENYIKGDDDLGLDGVFDYPYSQFLYNLDENCLLEDTAMTLSKTDISELARKGIITVKFTKVNGDLRTMRCTLMSEHLPPQGDIEEASTRSNPNTLAVWDLDNNGWRSFRIDSVTSVEVI